jgi:hypothetical protein
MHSWWNNDDEHPRHLPRRPEPIDAAHRITSWPVSGLAEATRATFPETVVSSGQRAS